MTEKEKVTELLNMGFTMEEALALAKGNYRTVPEQPQPDPEPQPESDPQPQPADQGLKDMLKTFGEQLTSSITATLIKQNIVQSNQPGSPQTADEILSKMLEPEEPNKERG